MRTLLLVIAAVSFAACDRAGPGQVQYGSSGIGPAADAVTACEQRGGKPVEFGGGHSPRTVVCFAPEVLR